MTARDFMQLTFPEVLGWFKGPPKPKGQGLLSPERVAMIEVEAKGYEYAARRWHSAPLWLRGCAHALDDRHGGIWRVASGYVGWAGDR